MSVKIVDISPLQNVSASSIAVKEADNSIYFSGKVGSINKNFLLGGFDQNGDPLSNFGLNGIVTTDISSEDIANCIKLVGEYILVGGSSILNGEHNFAIVKYTNQGEIEETFGTSGIITTNINPGSDDIAYSIDLQKDGDILLGGFSMLGLETNYAVVRYTSDGTLDTSFDVDGKVTINIGTNVHASAMTLSSYRIYLAGTSDDKDFSIAAILNNELALPVQLSSFVAVSKGATVDITWTSASETNTSLFVIERSLDGKHYSSLGQVTASKNSNTTRSYLFTDLKPSLINYYRLKVVDQDGRVSYGRVVVVRSATETSFSISPNPVHASFQVAIADPSVSSLTIYAVSGVPIRVINLPQAKGKRIVPVEAGSLASGTYFIKAGKQSIRFTKL